MAAGASSPELFTSLVSLFITHSSLGMGTIVGSEMFNQMCICGGSILASRNNQLALSPAIVLREVFFYGLSLALLLVAVRDRRFKEDDGSEEYRSIFIQWSDAYLLLAGYVLYVLVCAFYDKIVDFFLLLVGHREVKVDPTTLPATINETDASNIVLASIPFLRPLTREPRSNFYRPGDLQTIDLVRASSSQSIGSNFAKEYESLKPVYSNMDHQRLSSRLCTFMIDSKKPKPSKEHGLQDLTENQDGSFSCFLWQQSAFYDKARIGLSAWQLRWFTFSSEIATSVPDRSHQARVSTYPLFQQVEIDESHLVLQAHSAETDRVYNLMAPSAQILSRVVEHLGRHIMAQSDIEDDGSASIKSADALAMERGPSLVSYPYGASPMYQVFHLFLLPLKALMHFTVPDPRRVNVYNMKPKLSRSICCSVMCIVWLIVMSFVMVTALERLGVLLGIPNTVLGITVSAAGTSLPNYVASTVAARQGLGNQAVSNAFGSNSFNIFMGLGLPWALYTTIYGTYSNLLDDEITTSVFILAGALGAFVLLVFLSGFVLYRWHAYLFFGFYIVYVACAVGQVYI